MTEKITKTGIYRDRRGNTHRINRIEEIDYTELSIWPVCEEDAEMWTLYGGYSSNYSHADSRLLPQYESPRDLVEYLNPTDYPEEYL